MEEWKTFLSKFVNVIVDDPPSPYPRKKEGILMDISPTHLMIITSKIVEGEEIKKTEAIRLSDIRRVELKEEIK